LQNLKEYKCYEGVEYSVLGKRSATDSVRKASRDTEIEFYERFPAFVAATQAEYDADKDPSRKYISSRWEEMWKDDNTFRSRWVLRDFAKTKGEGDFFNPTPSKSASELVHIRALEKGHTIRYLDCSRAFPHAPELERIYTNTPAGYEWKYGLMARPLRKINDRRDGSQAFGTWFETQLVHMGFLANPLEPCLFYSQRLDISISTHMDDGCTEGADDALNQFFIDLGKIVMLKVTGELRPDGSHSDPRVKFLGRLRTREGATIRRYVDPKYVNECVALLELENAFPVPTPSTKLLKSKEGDNDLSKDDHSRSRTCVGKLLHCHEEYVGAQYTIKELSRALTSPSDADEARLKHCVLYLKGVRGTYRSIEPDAQHRRIEVVVDSDWAGSADRKSTECIVVEVLGANVHCSVKTQGNLSTSSGQAELGGIQRGAMFGVYVQNVWSATYGETLPITVHMDSAAGKVMGTRRGCGKVETPRNQRAVHSAVDQQWSSENRKGRRAAQ
jgi:hypothetical protein